MPDRATLAAAGGAFVLAGVAVLVATIRRERYRADVNALLVLAAAGRTPRSRPAA